MALECGTVTQSAVLTADLECPDGVTVGADGVRIDLRGHTLTSVGPGDVVDNPGFADFRIENGTLAARGDASGLRLSGADNRLRNLTVDVPASLRGGLSAVGTTDLVITDTVISGEGSDIEGTGARLTSVTIGGRDVRLMGSGHSISGSTVAFLSISGDDHRVRQVRTQELRVAGNRNSVVETTVGQWLRIDGGDNRVERNTNTPPLGFGPAPISVAGSGNTVAGNRVASAFGTGIVVSGSGTVRGNWATTNEGDGILVLSPGITVTANRADDNGGYGINAVPGVIDGGGNRARGNGNPAQCLNVVCRP